MHLTKRLRSPRHEDESLHREARRQGARPPTAASLMRPAIAILGALLAAAPLGAETLRLTGFLTARGVNSRSHNDPFGIAQIGATWTPSEHFAAHLHGIARREPDGVGGKSIGLVEAYLEGRAGGWQLRAGQFFLPSSRENKEPLWTSPYTIHLSALNSWIAEEFRPIGADLEWRNDFWTAGATAFRGNDTSGTLLAWRGWNIGNRLSVFREDLPLAPPPAFVAQHPGTRPFGSDLDGRTGFAGRVRFSLPERANLQLAHVDNRGDRRFRRGEYAWQTRFNIAGGEIGSRSPTTLAAEYAWGKTGMGFRGAPWVQMDFYAAYALLSHRFERQRISGRFDWFASTDRDLSPSGDNSEHGRAWAVAWMVDLTEHLRAGGEFTQIAGRRGAPLDRRLVSFELRYGF
jgi:hypothetical protein